MARPAESRGFTWRTWVGGGGAGLASVAYAALALRLDGEYLRLPWGRWDAVGMYMITRTIRQTGWYTWNPDLGWPYGMDAAQVPSPELRLWSHLRVITQWIDDPIVALNVFFLTGFLLVGATCYFLFSQTIDHRGISFVLAVAAATLPWHYTRFPHTLLADYSPVPLALLLAHWMWSHWWTDSWRRVAAALVASVYIGTSGLYYSFFACLVLGPVLLWRLVARRGGRAWLADVAVFLTIPVTFGLCLVQQATLKVTADVGANYASRSPLEALARAGDALSLVVPWPLQTLAAEGAAQLSVLGSIAVVVAFASLVAFAVAGLLSKTLPPVEARLRPWFRLLAWLTLWYLPGLGGLFAWTITPTIRAWGRLSIYVTLVAMVIFGILLERVMRRLPAHRWVVPASLGAILVAQLLLDHRALLPIWSARFDREARTYVAALDRTVPQGCPLLQLPTMRFPEDWTYERMGATDHMWIPVYDDVDHKWSFGAVRGTVGGDAIQERYALDVGTADLVRRAREDGYCAIQLDRVGLRGDEVNQLGDLLGTPDAEVGRWVLYSLR